MDNNFEIRKPYNSFLADIVDHYFYIDISVSELSVHPEYIIPFPRITFGYFFDHPFTAANHSLNESILVKAAISRISTQKITVQPQTEKVKILGAHLRPFGLAYFTQKPVNTLPWLIDTEKLYGEIAIKFFKKVNAFKTTDQMFVEIEKVFLDNILIRDLSLITNAIELIEKNNGSIEVSELSKELKITERTLRNHFYNHIGCSPKEFLRIVKLKQVAYQLKEPVNSLTQIAYDNNYFDQAHFIKEVKNITGHSPSQLKKEMRNFRFLQF
jgi:AraC-like DNA-binding protein